MTDYTQLMKNIDGTIDEVGSLPDGSGFAVVSMSLPGSHWLYAKTEDYEPPPMLLRCGTDHVQHEKLCRAVWAAAKYAVRAATMNGKLQDFDPDALCQSMVVGLLGYHTSNGLSSDDFANPNPIPPRLSDLIRQYSTT